MSQPQPVPMARSGATSALVLLLALNLFNYIDRQVLAAVEPDVSRTFGLSGTSSGLLASGFLIAYMFAAPLLGRLADRVSRWKLIGCSVLVWSLATGMSGFAFSFYMLLFCRIIVGIGEAGYGPAAPSLIADYFPVEKRGRVMALFYLAIPVGSALGYVYGGLVNQALNWRWAFWLVVPVEVGLGLLCLGRREPRPIPSKVARPSFLDDVRKLLKIRSYVLNTVAMAAMTFAIGGMAFWIPKYMTGRLAIQRGVDIFSYVGMQANEPARKALLGEVTFKFGIITVVAGLISTFMGGWLGDKFRRRYHGAYLLVSAIAILIAFPCTLAMLWWPFPYAWVALFCAVFFLFFNTGPANTALANVTSSALRPTAFALNIFVVHALGDAVSPPLIGWIVDHTNWDTAFTIVSLMMVFASTLWFIGARYLAADERKAEEELNALSAGGEAPGTPA